jgi:hydroxyacylglutathione hydrolase
MTANVQQFLCRSDNFGLLLHDATSGATAAIDVPDAGPYLAALKQHGWTLSDILITHRHGDHIDGVPALRAQFPQAKLHIPAAEAERIETITGKADAHLREDDGVNVGTLKGIVIETPGHTLGHIAYHFSKEHLLFVGDTLFSLGCGRVFEGTMEQMWKSLCKLATLPPETRLWCGHEYTQANGRFALSIEPNNAELQARMKEVDALRLQGAFTLPVTLKQELATNPFLRAGNATIFADLRERKNKA